MKLILHCLLFLFTCSSFAQITLEQTYNDRVNRIKLEYSGEKYYEFKKETNELNFYNSNHSLWKTIVLPASMPNKFAYTRVFHVSEAKINPDTNLEIIFGYHNSITSSYESKIISEDGTVLLTIPNASEVYLDEISGLADKLITVNIPNNEISKVYSVPELVLENTYNYRNLKRIKLENSGEKYYLLDKTNSSAKIYNANHSLWKTVSLPKPTNAIYTKIDVISETQINPVALLEIGYSYSITVNNITQFESKIVNENNLVLLILPNTRQLQISTIDGLADKLIAENLSDSGFSTSIYDLPSLTLGNAYQGMVTRVKLENSGEKYYTSSYPLNNQVKIYNSNHTLWKTINLPLPQDLMYDVSKVNNLSETKFDNDTLIELSYAYAPSGSLEPQYSSRVINESGTVMLESSGIQDLYLNEIQGLQNKLIGYTYDPFRYFTVGKVYSFETLGTSDYNKNSKVVIAPNPAKSFININSFSVPIIAVMIYNVNGIVVKKETSQNITKIDINQLPTGIYIVNLTDSNNQIYTHKITILH